MTYYLYTYDGDLSPSKYVMQSSDYDYLEERGKEYVRLKNCQHYSIETVERL